MQSLKGAAHQHALSKGANPGPKLMAGDGLRCVYPCGCRSRWPGRSTTCAHHGRNHRAMLEWLYLAVQAATCNRLPFNNSL